MAEPFIGQISIFSFNFPPKGWAFCNGQLLPINQNQALFSLLGTMYGGDGRTTFALPDLRGRVPMHFGSVHVQGERAGTEAATVTASTMPPHFHHVPATSAAGASDDPTGKVPAQAALNVYGTGTGAVMAPAAVGAMGGSQPHENRQPFLTLTCCIALNGIFPSQN